MNRVVRHLAALAVALSSLINLAAAQQAETAKPSGKAALAQARALAGAAKGKQGLERATALEAGARAFLAVAEQFKAEPMVVAEASFEAAELFRRKGDLAEAEGAYRAALTGDPTRFGVRATYELAHLMRRAKKADDAVTLYRKVAEMQPGTARAQSALLWVGRTLQLVGKLDDAATAFRDAFTKAATPSAVITAGNWLAKALLKKGDLDGARGTLAEVDKRVAGDATGDSPAAQRLQTTLAEMTARKALQRALDKKSGAAGDAEVVDADEKDEKEEEEAEAPARPTGRGGRGGN